MYLKKSLWSEGITPKPSSESEPEPSPTAVSYLVNSLTQQRVYREVKLRLRSGLRDVCAEFSFLHVRGLLKFLRSIVEFDSTINLFSQTQSLSELQDSDDEIVQNLDHIFGVEPLKITSPSTDFEVSLMLRVLEGCCLLRPDSAVLAHQHKAIQVLMNILPTRGVIEQGACLDALIAFMLDSSANQMDFEAFHGIEEVVGLIRDKQIDENLRF
ncbi:uncharacterized protein LOC103957409 isoform X1 [Pyrus x bretschneideri]|uniref:uncharacterized protein LOC103957409 isoform X1 n=1 Tax=Pyrus x bretschneideri TaxID=225117 RepID=UPI00202ED8A4|nr:uncharacterized protein LOC103957409 isoform X1 [Pyrus x bretschneideri]